MSQNPELLPGTRPAGPASEEEAGRQVREMFSRIAPRYDLLNHLLSLEVDRLWRMRLARRFGAVLKNPEASVLDLCCGTGDLAATFRRAGPARVVGVDFAHPMVTRAVAKDVSAGASCGAVHGRKNQAYIEADALELPFADARFDLVATAFGFRNLANYERGLIEIRRVLKPGGALAILEFSEPRSRVFGAVYRFYFRSVLPRIGRAISRDGTAYSYLPASVGRFLSVDELVRMIERVGFRGARSENWTGGVVALHTATR
jgi:demethylmenaquinone methyltransferase/2-methoxy-6-polyprenyl-1,4-benzoquinol methylase